MKKLFLKSLTISMAVILLVCSIPFTATAATYSGSCGTNASWSFNTSTGLLKITGSGAMEDYTIKISGYPNFSVSTTSPWFDYADSIKSVEIGDGITSIGNMAFTYLDALKSVKIGKSVEIISGNAFAECSSLETLNIPASVEEIDELAFYGLKSITVEKGNKYFITDDYGVLFDKQKRRLIFYPDAATAKSYNIPNTVETIDTLAFYLPYNLKTIKVPSSINFEEIVLGIIYSCVELNKDCNIEKIYYTGSYNDLLKDLSEDIDTSEISSASKIKQMFRDELGIEFVFNYIAIEDYVSDFTEIICTPSTNTINYGDTLVLHSNINYLPEGYSLEWSIEGNGMSLNPILDGFACEITAIQSGTVIVKATIVDEYGTPVASIDSDEATDCQQLTSNASFWQKIVSFFKNLFGISRIIEQFDLM